MPRWWGSRRETARPGVRVLRADDRPTTSVGGRTTAHCFSFGDHYDPDNTGFGALRVVNEEDVPPGGGYGAHRHADTEIVTWVLAGELAHEDSTGTSGTVRPGQVQHLSAGAGVEHTERNGSDVAPLRYVQMELAPSAEQLAADPAPPAYRQEWVEGSRGHLLEALRVRDDARLLVAFCDTDDHLWLPADVRLHVHLTRGRAVLDDVGTLGAGDTARLDPAPSRRLVAWADSEVLVWSLGT